MLVTRHVKRLCIQISFVEYVQGHIWRVGYAGGDLKGVLFDDVPEALRKWQSEGTKTYIYSSGSREAQRLIFGYTKHGDMRPYLSGFFDTTIGYVSFSSIIIQLLTPAVMEYKLLVITVPEEGDDPTLLAAVTRLQPYF